MCHFWEAKPSWVFVCRQSDVKVRRALRNYRVGSIIQLGILGYVAVALPYWTKVRHSAQSNMGCACSPPCRKQNHVYCLPCAQSSTS